MVLTMPLTTKTRPKQQTMPTANVGQDDLLATGLRRCPGQVSGQNALHSGVHK
jgi:hypothetical protein